MTPISCLFSATLPDGSKISHRCTVPKIPETGDIVGLTGISGKSYTGAVARVSKVNLLINISLENDYCYGVSLELVEVAAIDVPCEIIEI